jgi:hypothetical protein
MSIEIELTAVDPSRTDRVESDFLVPGNWFASLRDAPSCNLHKAWHAIHFLLTGSAEEAPLPEGYLLDGGRELGEPDPEEMEAQPRLLSPEEVKAFAEVVRPLDEQELRRRFDHAAMLDADVYSIGPEEEEEFEFVAQFLEELRTFVTEADEAGHGAVVTMG